MRTLFKRLLFSLLVAVFLLGAFEVGVRVSGVVADRPLPSALGFQMAAHIGLAGTAPGTWNYSSQRTRAVLSEPAGKRILVFGGSAAFGDGVGFWQTFSAHLESQLARLSPEEGWEVVNLGIGGLSSTQIQPLIVRELNARPPDLVLIYSGNNEFHQLRARMEVDPEYSARTELWRRRLWRSQLYRYLAAWFLPTPAPPKSSGVPIHALKAEVGADERALVDDIYEENLREMVSATKRAGVPVLLSTVADNHHYGGAGVEAEDDELMREFEVVNALEGASLSEVLDEELQPSSALMLAERWLNNGRQTDALALLVQAETTDPRPSRSNDQMRDTLRAVAASEDVMMCDVAKGLAQRSEHGIVNHDYFLDSCHPNIVGHTAMAELFLACLQAEGFAPAGVPPVIHDPFRLFSWDGEVASGDDATALALAGHAAANKLQYKKAARLYEESLAAGGEPTGLHLSLASLRLAQFEFTLAQEHLQQALAASPEDPEVRNAAKALGLTR